eukprot:8968364-Lingulodinium_polyedra.AAC.1
MQIAGTVKWAKGLSHARKARTNTRALPAVAALRRCIRATYPRVFVSVHPTPTSARACSDTSLRVQGT